MYGIISAGSNPLAYFTGAVFAVLLAGYCILKRREHLKRNDKGLKYSKVQVVGILGIIFFFGPVFWITINILTKGIFFLAVFIEELLCLPLILINIIAYILQISSVFFLVYGLYFAGSYLWPIKRAVKVTK